MSFLERNVKVNTGNTPPMILCYGGEGVGKSTFASEAPKPIFFDYEDSTKYLSDTKVINIREQPNKLRYDYTIAGLDALINEEHDYKTVVIDTLDWAERSFIRGYCEEHNANGFYDPYNKATTYGAGKAAVVGRIQIILEKLDWLNKNKQMYIIILAHKEVDKVEDPLSGSFSKNIIDSQLEETSKMFVAKSDCVLYMAKKIIQSSKDPNKAIEDGVVIHTRANIATSTKDRLGLPAIIDAPKGKAWQSFMQAIGTNN